VKLEIRASHCSFQSQTGQNVFYFNTKYISYGAFSSDVFTEEPKILQEFLKSHTAIFSGGFESPDRFVGPL